MAESSDELERLSREQLILKARVLGVERAELMTRVEMRDEIVRRSEPDLAQQTPQSVDLSGAGGYPSGAEAMHGFAAGRG